MHTHEPVISTQHLSKYYTLDHKKVHALEDINITIDAGEFVTVVGRSGSGKSTLLQLVGGLDAPSSGTVCVGGNFLADMNQKELASFRNHSIGFIFQFFYLQPMLTLAQNIELPGIFMGTSKAARAKRISDLAEVLNLGDRLNHHPAELSGGQIQRASIARALFNNPKILLADEPTGNLDEQSSKEFIDLLLSVREQFGTTVVMSTHDEAIMRKSDRSLRIGDGVISD